MQRQADLKPFLIVKFIIGFCMPNLSTVRYPTFTEKDFTFEKDICN